MDIVRPLEVEAYMRAERAAKAAALEEARALVARLEADLGAYDRILNAAAMPPPARPPTQRKASAGNGRSREGTLTHFVVQGVRASGAALSRREIGDMIDKSSFAEQHRKNPNGLYNILARAVERAELRERDGRFYDATVEPSDLPPRDSATAPTEPKSWPEMVYGLLVGNEKGQTTDVLKSRIQGSVWADKLRVQPTILWSALDRLERKGIAAKHGNLWFEAAIYDRILSGDLKVDLPDDGPKDSIPEAIIAALRDSGVPLKSAEIIDRIRANPEIDERIGKSGALAYTHLSKMWRKDQLARVGDQGAYAKSYDLPDRALKLSANVITLPAKNGGQR